MGNARPFLYRLRPERVLLFIGAMGITAGASGPVPIYEKMIFLSVISYANYRSVAHKVSVTALNA